MTVNTRILAAEFEYLEPDTLQEALQLIDQHGSNAKVIAGGTDILAQMKNEAIAPKCLINVMKISGMSFIKREKEWLRIGAAAKWSDILRFCDGDLKYMALNEAIHTLGKVQVRNMGTVGGNLCTASPAADSAPALLVFDSRVKLVSVEGERILNLEDFFLGVNKTVMNANEIMTEVHVPSLQTGTGSAFMKLTRVGADISKISCAVALERQEKICVKCHIALGAVAPVPMRAKKAEKSIHGKEVDSSLVEDMGDIISDEIKPITDIRSTAEYRRQVAAVLGKDVFWKAWHRAGEEA